MPATAHLPLAFARREAILLANRWGVDSPEQVLVFGREVGGRVDGQGDQTMTVETHTDTSSALAVISIEGGPFEWTMGDGLDRIAAAIEDDDLPYFAEPINHYQVGIYNA